MVGRLVGFYGISLWLVWVLWHIIMAGWLVGFYGISTFVGYLTPNLF